jgi:alternate signal-mediated exported protein
MNNKMIKGSVAGATGIVLLMGGFGTYALWSDSATLPGSEVTSGELTITANDDAAWDDGSGLWDENTDLLVPGDTVTRTQTFTVTGTGKNLSGTISLSGGAISENGFMSSDTTPVDLLDVSLAVTAADDDLVIVPNTATDEPNDFVFSGPFTNGELTTVVTYALSAGASGTDAQKASADMAATTFTIAQN